MITQALNLLFEKKNLEEAVCEQVFSEIMNGEATNAQIAGFLTAMRMKGETIEEITACAKVLRKCCKKIQPMGDVLDIVGTGGDMLSTFNISTVSSFVIAASGTHVAKHGNRAVSSKCGSADVLESLGVKIDASKEVCERAINEIGIGFLFAPHYHLAMKYASSVRKELGARTIFNILGPLANPASATMQLLGVYDANLTYSFASALKNLGVKKAMVVHGHDGLDEISISASTTICEVRNNKINSFLINPEMFGLNRSDISEIKGGTAKENAEIALNILNGEKSPKRDIVVLNSALAIYMASENLTLKQSVAVAQEMLDSKKALNKLKQLIEFTN